MKGKNPLLKVVNEDKKTQTQNGKDTLLKVSQFLCGIGTKLTSFRKIENIPESKPQVILYAPLDSTTECSLLFRYQNLTLKAPITTAADAIHNYFFIVFQRK